MKKTAIYCEYDFDNKKIKDVSFELISKAFKLKTHAKNLLKNSDTFTIDAVILADEINEEEIKKAYCAGADEIILIKNENFKNFDTILYSKAFVEFYKTKNYDAVLFPATTKTRMTAPRITTLLETGLVADCSDVDFILKNEELKLAPTRPTFGAELMATILSKKNPQCATIRSGVFEADFNNKSLSCENCELNFTIYNSFESSNSNIKIIEEILKEKQEDYFSNAEIIFACGYGISGEKGIYFDKIKTLADKFNAKLGATRKVVDFKYLSAKHQIGQTGTSVKPEIYITFGISGAIQHICGMKNSKTVISINTDENAEIFKYSDYKIVDDAKKIIDEMLKI